MRKRFTFMMAVLALLTFLAAPLGMWGQTTVTWPGTSALPGTATAVANDQNVTIKTSSTNTYTNPIRIYANTTVTINALNGAKILSVAYEASSTGDYVTNAQNATVSPNVTPTVSNKIITWTYAESANVTEFTFQPSAQTRSNGISITYKTSSGGTTYTVTFDAGDGTFVGNADFPNTTNQKVAGTYSLPNATKASHTLLWSDGTDTYEAGEDYEVTEDVDFTAQWTESGGGSTTTEHVYIFAGANNFYTDANLTTHPSSGSSNNVGTIYYGDGSVFVASGTARYFSNASSGYFLLGKTDAQISLPTFEGYKITQVKVHSSSGHSISVSVSIVSGSNTASAAKTWSTQNHDYVYDIAEAYQTSALSLNVTNNYNSQFTSITIVCEQLSTDPIINATNPEALAYNATGGEFDYTITNPTGASLNATSNSDWITNVAVDGENSKVTFNTSTNTAFTQRVGTITLTYTGATDKVITITQNAAPTPTITAADVEIAYDATGGSIAYSINNVPTPAGTLTADIKTGTTPTITDFAIGTVTSNTIPFNCADNSTLSAHTATVTLTYTYDTDKTVTKDVTVTQAHLIVDYATLPFNWAGGTSGDLTALTGVTGNSLGDYAVGNAPYRVQFNADNDYIQIKTNNRPGIVTFGVKMIGGGATSSITVQGSSDGETFNAVQTFTISGNQNSIHSFSTTTDFANSVRYVKLNFNKGSGSNVGVGPITIAQYLEKVATPTFSPAEGTYTSAQNVTISCETEDATIYYTTDGSNPTTSSTEYTSAISVDVTQTIKAIAVKEGMANSAIATAAYTINTPSIIVSSTSVEANATETEGTIIVTYNHIASVDSEVLFYEADGETEADYTSWLDADIDNDGNVYYLIRDNTDSARTGFIKVHEKNNNVYSELITIHQATLMITGSINFGSASGSTNINSASVSGYDAMGNTWTITTEGTTSFTPNAAYAQVGSSKKPATSITFTTTLSESVSIADFKAKFGGFGETEGTITLKVGETTVGTGSLNGTDDVTVVNSSMAEGTTLTVTVTDIDKGVKCYYIDYTILSYDIYGSTEITNFTIPKDETLTIHDGGVLTITGTMTNNGTAANLIIEDGGQLKFYDNGAKDGVKATVEKNISAWPNTTPADGWYFIASPVNVANYNPSSAGLITDNNSDPSNCTYDFYYLAYENDKPMWKNYRNASFSMANGHGYLYANKSNQTLAFAGAIKPYDADYTIPVTEGWNLVGNPYTFNAYANRRYYKIDPSSTIIEPVADNEAVPPCTGIIVNTEDSGASVTFTDTQSGTSYVNQGNLQMVLAQNVATRGERTAQTLDKAIVSFNEGSQLGKFYFGTQDANLYIPQDNEEFAIVSSNAQGEMPVNFKAYRDGQYTLTVNPEAVEMGYLHLIDNIAGKEVDLLANPSYTFNAKADDYESRFRLVFSANMVNADLNDDFAFFSNGQLIIANEGEAILQVIDVTGRVVATENINGTCSKAINAKVGVYVLRLINGTDVKTQKMVIR